MGVGTDLHPGKRPPAGLPGPQPWSVGYKLGRGEAALECGNLFPLSPVPLPFRQCPFSRRTLLVPFTQNHSANTSPVPLSSRQCPFLTTYLARSLYPEPFREHLGRATAVSARAPSHDAPGAFPLRRTQSANTYPVSLPARQCSTSRRTLLVRITLNHSANTSWCHCRLGSAPSCDGPCTFALRRTIPRTAVSCHCRLAQCSFPRRTTQRSLYARTIPRTAFGPLPHTRRRSRLWSAGDLLPFSGLQTPASTPVRASPISQLRSPISDTLCPRARNRNRLCISLCSLCFLLFILFFVFVLVSIVTHFRRGEPRKTRNNTKVWQKR